MTIKSQENIEWFRDRLLTWAEEYLRDYPWRITSDPGGIPPQTPSG
ncbi:MAG: hypothetical protein AAF383_26645 [Cyanobacteria bacterium P01_A01_bin.83]